MLPVLERPPSLTDSAVVALRDAIRARRFVPGPIYSVSQVAEELGVSRSPVREALLKLTEAGLVEFARNRGFRIILPTARDLAEIFAVRLALEVPAAGRVARSGTAGARREIAARLDALETDQDEAAFWADDRRLHALILTGAGNTRAARIVESLRATTSLLGEPTGRTRAAIHAEHRPIVEGILARDGAAAEAAMRAHLTATGQLLMVQTTRPGAEVPDVRQIWADVVGPGD
jgi:DNA-binding GntR family transcriptional regulator